MDMTTETLKRSIDLMFMSAAPVLTMEFQGGEPLLKKDLFCSGVDMASSKARQQDRDIRFVLCTNGRLLDGRLLEFCRTNNIMISTSLDGPRSLHNANRPSIGGSDSYVSATNTVGECQRILGDDGVSALLTVTRQSLSQPKAIVDEYVYQGLRNIFVRPLNPYGRSVSERSTPSYTHDEFMEFYFSLFSYVMELNLSGVDVVEDFAALLMRKIVTPYSTGFVDLQSPAGVISAVCAYDYDGSVYVSDEGRMLAAEGDRFFRMGSVEDQYCDLFFGDLCQSLIPDLVIEGLAGCSECAYQPYCGADPVKNYATGFGSHGFRPRSDLCKRITSTVDHLIDILDSDSETARILYSWAARG